MNPAAYLEMAETESLHWWFVGRRAILSKVIEGLRIPAGAEILEVGCGTGGNLHMLSRFGAVSAIDMDESARDIASRKTQNLYVIKPGFCPDDVPFPDGKFDLICMFDVLEHVEQDVEALGALKRLLKKDGRILLTVPAYQWLWGPHDEFLHHKRRYSRAEFRSKIAASGFKPLKISYFNTILFPLAAMVRIKDKLLRNGKVSGTSVPVAPVNRVFTSIFCGERVLLERMNLPFGVSLLGVLKAV